MREIEQNAGTVLALPIIGSSPLVFASGGVGARGQTVVILEGSELAQPSRRETFVYTRDIDKYQGINTMEKTTMETARVARLGHVGLHVQDLEKQKAFYRDIIGLTVTDEDTERGMVFMSSRPEEEHHELLLYRGRNVVGDAKVVQQISFRCNTFEDVLSFYRRFKQHNVKFDMIMSHGNAFISSIPRIIASRRTGTPGLKPSNRMAKCWILRSRRRRFCSTSSSTSRGMVKQGSSIPHGLDRVDASDY
jgi:hypothetical protein